MRIPIPWVVVLVVLVISMTWWRGTIRADFLTPPTEEELAQIRQRVEAALPRAGTPADAISVPDQNRLAVAVTRPLVELGDVSAAPKLDEYSDRAPQGAAHLIELATLLEAEGHFQRTLLAWERVLDQTQADDSQRQAAFGAIQRIKPTLPDWNANPETRIPILLQAGTGKTLAESVEPVLEKIARDLEIASSGILQVTHKVNAAQGDLAVEGPAPVAMWLGGLGDDAPSTDVLSFTVASADSLENDCLRTVYQLVRGQFRSSGNLVRPAPLPDEGDPMDVLKTQITRRIWLTFGKGLQPESAGEAEEKKSAEP